MKRITALLFLIAPMVWGQTGTWSGNVGKIIYENCAACHRTGGIAPFPLTSYQDAVDNALSISNSLNSGSMPPWTPDPNYKSYVHQRVMKQADKNAVLQWIENNTPSGDLRFAPQPLAHSTNSQLGTPDLSLTIPTFTVNSDDDVYHNFELPSGLSVLNYAKAIEVIPGNTAIVHHVLVFEDNSTNPINPNSVGGTGSSASKLLFGYTPGAQPYYTPEGTGLKLNANTRIIVQVHYAPGSMGLTDATTINFKLTTAAQREIQVNPLLNHFTNMTNGPLTILANTTKTFNEQFTCPITATLLYVFPHMHRVGRSIETYGTTTTGSNIPFVKIPNWEFHWQDNFVFPNTVKINAGTVLKSVAFYDNTADNPDNPNSPPQTVSAGENTGDEMMLSFFAYLPYQAGDENLIVDKRIIPSTATTFCEGQSVTLNTIEGTGYTYQWKKDGNPIATATTAHYEANNSGNYTVTIALGNNQTTSDAVAITVLPAPVASITPSGSAAIPTGGTVTLTATSGIGYNYQWYKDGEAIIGETNSTYTAAAAGDYTVEVYNGCYALSETTVLTTALGNDHFNGTELVIYPNPNNGVFYVKNAQNYQMSIFTLSGQLLLKDTISNTNYEISLKNRGLYFIEVTAPNGDKKVAKMVIE